MAGGRLWSDDEVALLVHDRYGEYVLAARDAGLVARSPSAWSKARDKQRKIDVQIAIESMPPSPTMPDLDNFGDDIGALYEAVKQTTKAMIGLVDKPTTFEWTAPENDWCGFVFVGDIHVGGLVDYEQLEADLECMEQTPGLHVIGMGDYADRFEHSQKLQAAMAGNTAPASDVQEKLVLHALSRCRKWVAVAAGNHDDWGSGEVVRRLAQHLNAHYISQAGALMKLNVGSERYVLYLKHQYTGASRISTSNESRRFWQEFGVPGEYANADVTVVAHLHQPDTHQVERKGNTVAHLRGGTFKTVDPWARKGGYCPAYGPSLVLFNPHDHEAIPFHGPQWRRGVQMLAWLRGSG